MSDVISVKPSQDWPYLEGLIRMLWDQVADDNCGTVDTFKLKGFAMVQQAAMIKVLRNNASCGAFLFVAQEDGVAEIHTLLTPRCRGRLAIEAGKAVVKFAFENMNINKITSRCPNNNRASLYFAMRCGFSITGKQQDWVKNGQNLGSTHVELNRQNWKG